MKTPFSFIILISFSWAIGLKGLIIPENGHVLSMASTGIAGGFSPGLNPAIHESEHSYIQFSLNRWFADIKGSHMAYQWGRAAPQTISIQSWNANDLELWGEQPNSSPLGTFGVHYMSVAYSISHDLNTPYRFGIRIQANYTHLYTEFMNGITLDAGVLFPLSSLINIGGVVRNIGYENTNNLTAELPMEMGMGTELKLPFQMSLLTDIVLSEKETDIRIGFRTHWKWLNMHAGISIHDKRTSRAAGFSFTFRDWLINYGIYSHENSILGIPQFLDVRRYI